jgi:hypothetical protein
MSLLDESDLILSMNKRIINNSKLPVNASKDKFEYWWANLRNIFKTNGIDIIVMEPKPSGLVEIKEEDTSKLNIKDEGTIRALNYRTKSNAAYAIMVGLMEDKLYTSLQHLHTYGNAHEMYKLLKDKFAPNTQITGFKAMHELLNVRLGKDEKIQDVINRINGFADQVSRFKNSDEYVKLLALYQSVPLAYQELLSDKLFVDPNFNFSKATLLLVSHEDIMKLGKNNNNNNNNTGTSNKAFQAKQHHKYNKDTSNKYCAICKTSNSHNTDYCWKNPLNPNNKLGIDSKTVDHRIKNKNSTGSETDNNNSGSDSSKDENTKTTNNNNSKKQVKFSAKHVTVHKMMKNIVRNNNKAVLLLDSGCSVNISNDKNLLTNIRQIDPIIVEVANGECIEAYESGDLTLGPYTHPSTDIELTIELQNVIYSNQ